MQEHHKVLLSEGFSYRPQQVDAVDIVPAPPSQPTGDAMRYLVPYGCFSIQKDSLQALLYIHHLLNAQRRQSPVPRYLYDGGYCTNLPFSPGMLPGNQALCYCLKSFPSLAFPSRFLSRRFVEALMSFFCCPLLTSLTSRKRQTYRTSGQVSVFIFFMYVSIIPAGTSTHTTRVIACESTSRITGVVDRTP